jgi:beta-galactosidase
MVEKMPNFLGEFLWTGMDYIGEAGVGAATNVSIGGVAYNRTGWPWVNAWCGDIDLIGHQKAPSRYRDVVWGLSELEIGVQRPVPEGKMEVISNWGWSDELLSWSWPGHEGKEIAVRLFTPGDRVALLLDGRKVGEKTLSPADKMRTEIKLAYTPGLLEAVAYKGGAEIGRKRIETVTAAAKLQLSPERKSGPAHRQALYYVPVDVLDGQGRLMPDDKRSVRLSIEGPAELVGFGSANPLAVGSFQAPTAETFHGRAMAILRATGTKGTVRLAAAADGLTGAATTLNLV